MIEALQNEVELIEENLTKYISKYQRELFKKEVEELEPGHAMVVSDYMMKLMFQKLYEPQRDWFGKKRSVFAWHDVFI